MANVYIKTVNGGQDLSPALTDAIELDDGTTSTWTLLSAIYTLFKTSFDAVYGVIEASTFRKTGVVGDPAGWYTNIRAQVIIFRTDAAITITRIHIHGADLTPTSELAGDLKFADDINIGGFANATVIDVCDTTNGVFTATSGFDDATVPSGKYVYFQMDAAPHADWKDFYIEVYYTYD